MGQTITLHLPLGGGLDQKTSPHYLDPSQRVALVQDGNYAKINVVDKRMGISRQTPATTSLVNGRLASWSKGDVTILSQAGASTFEPQLPSGSSINPLGSLPPPTVTRRPVVTVPSPIPPVLCDVPYNGTTLRVAAYQGTLTQGTNFPTVYVTVWDANTQTVVLPPTVVYTSTSSSTVIPISILYIPQAASTLQVAIFVLDTNAASGNVKLWAVNYNQTNNRLGTAVSVQSTLATGPVLDVAPFINDNLGRYMVLWTTTNSQVSVSLFNPNHTVNAASIIVWTAPVGYIAGGINNPAAQGYVYGTFGEKIWILMAWTGGSPTMKSQFRAFDAGTYAALASAVTLMTGTQLYLIPPIRVSSALMWCASLAPAVATQAPGPATAVAMQSFAGQAYTCTVSATTNTAPIPIGFYPAARPFMATGDTTHVYVPCYFDLYSSTTVAYSGATTSLQGTLFLLQAPVSSNGFAYPVATSAPRQVDTVSVNNYITLGISTPHVPWSSAVSGTEFHVGLKTLPLDTIGNAATATSQTATSTWETGFSFSSLTGYQAVELGGELHISGGVPFVCDGQFTFEDGFFYYPEFSYVGPMNAAGGTALRATAPGSVGQYTYAVVYVYQDAAGNFHRSAPSFTVPQSTPGGITASIAAGGGGKQVISGLSGMTAAMVGGTLAFAGAATGSYNSGTFTITDFVSATSVKILDTGGGADGNNGNISWSVGLSMTVYFPPITTWRDAVPLAANTNGSVFAEIYRTTASPASPIFYLVDRVPASMIQGIATIYVSWVDTVADTSITTATVLYTTGGVLDQVCAPASGFHCLHKGRKVASDDTKRALWLTQQYQAGQQAGNHEALVIQFSEKEDVTAAASMDASLVVFKKSSIWVIYGGDGPNQLGQGSDLTTPQRVPSDVGAVDWRGVVLTPMGVMFVASSGIYLLDRALSVSFIGKNVLDLFASYPTCTASILVSSANQVRFFMTNGTTSIVLIYDYLLQTWLEHTRPQWTTTYVTGASVTAAGLATEVTATGCLLQEHASTDTNPWLDDDVTAATHFVSTKITCADLKGGGPGAVQGYQRARWVQCYADLPDPCGVNVQITVNGASTVVQGSLTSYQGMGGSPNAPGVAALHVAGAYQKQMALGITVFDSSDVATVTGQGARFVGVTAELDVIGQRYRQIPPAAMG